MVKTFPEPPSFRCRTGKPVGYETLFNAAYRVLKPAAEEDRPLEELWAATCESMAEAWPTIWSALLQRQLICHAVVPGVGLVEIPPGSWAAVRTAGPPGLVPWADPAGAMMVEPLLKHDDIHTLTALWSGIDPDEQTTEKPMRSQNAPQVEAPEEPHIETDAPKRTRRKAFSLDEADAPLIAEMRRMIEYKEAPSITAAAGIVFDEMKEQVGGFGSDESRRKRLQRAYRKTFGSD